MKPTHLTIAIAVALGALAGCDRNPKQEPRASAVPQQQPAGTGSSAAQSNTPSTPANIGQPNQAEKKDGANPTQGQVDPKQGEQHKDFQHRGDGAGPKPGG
jgi:hypothetical protein